MSVLEFANVAGPCRSIEERHGIVRDAVEALARARRVALDEVFDRRWNVFGRSETKDSCPEEH
jgi:hypothetical protein